MNDKQLQRELIEGQRLLNSQMEVFNDEIVILNGRITNYLKSHRTDVLWNIFESIFQLGREYERYNMYESSVMTLSDKATRRDRMSQTKKEQNLKKAIK